MAAFINICLQGTVYFTSYKRGKDDSMLQLFSNKLLGIAKECTFDALYSLWPGGWRQQDDIVYPFRRNRCADDVRHSLIQAVWTFDLDNDILRIDKDNRSAQISLELARRTAITIPQFESYTTMFHRGNPFLAMYPPPYAGLTRQNLDVSHLRRRKALLSRILGDLAFQWRHVLSGPYNNYTFRRLAYAIIRILALDFDIVEINVPRRGAGGMLVSLQDLPSWNIWNKDIVQVGAVSIVVCQHLCHAKSVIKADFRNWTTSSPKADSSCGTVDFRTYLIFSMKEIFLYQIRSDVERFTKSEPFFDGTSGFYPGAVDMLLEATQQYGSTLAFLPEELKDMIFQNITASPLQLAKIGCDLNIGPIFGWKSNNRSIEREEGRRNRTTDTPVESQVWFDDCFSGLAYKEVQPDELF